MRSTAPRVFVSYAHDSDGHKAEVRSLCELLADHGIDILLDQWVVDKTIWSEWAERLCEADFVIVIASPLYKARVDGGRSHDHGTGVLYEARLLRDLVVGFPDSGHGRILSVLLPGHGPEEIPRFLLPHSGTYYRVPRISEDGVTQLIVVLTTERRVDNADQRAAG